jgi:hypothetical protein
MAKEIKHYGILRRSGRYPWGSGEQPYQSGPDFLRYTNQLKKQGKSEKEIADQFGIKTTELRKRRSIARNEERAADRAQALRLKDKGYSNVAIGERMGKNESTIRSLLDDAIAERAKIASQVSDILKESVEENEYIDIGVGTENHLGVSKTKLNVAVKMLEDQGYEVRYIRVPQLGTEHMTTVKVLTKPGVPYKEVYANQDRISLVNHKKSLDGGRTFLDTQPPVRYLDSTKVKIRHKEDGGDLKDGVIELRRGVPELSLGNSRYAQVRIGVDGTHYMKGMAMYSDDIPKGYDVVYNTSKSNARDRFSIFKPMEPNAIGPFGAATRNKYYVDKDGKTRISCINVLNEEGEWGGWSDSLSSQMLSKQRPSLVKQQLELSLRAKRDEYADIQRLTNPAVKRRLLQSFSDDADAAAVHLKAAGMPRQSWAVILPVTSLKPNEVYAPNYKDGENVVLIRYPHGGTFEIPHLRVNNKHRGAISVMRNARDAIGINPKVAAQLSGADFDGDTVLVIPNRRGQIKSTSPLAGLKDFDPRTRYKGYPGMKVMDERTKQREMGKVSNLITDMTIRGASQEEIARAVRHSMVVIDAEKHKLNYKQSAKDNGISSLKKKYQGGATKGASTIISKASAEKRVDHRSKYFTIDKKTGKKIYRKTGETYINADGKLIKRTSKSKQMLEVDDAHKLSSGTIIERYYANYANKMKALANDARKTMLSVKSRPYSKSAKEVYSDAVASLNAKLDLAMRRKPLERQAQLLGNKLVALEKQNDPGLSGRELMKVKGRALQEARRRLNAPKEPFVITNKEWAAIQAGAITNNRLKQILDVADLDRVKELATPRTARTVMTAAKRARAKSMLAAGYTQAEVSHAIGVSIKTMLASVDKEVNDE